MIMVSLYGQVPVKVKTVKFRFIIMEAKMFKIEVLGTGCAKCNKLEETARKAADELGVEYEVIKVKDINDIMNYGVMVTPALVVNGVVKVAGKVPAIEEVKKMING